MTLFGLPVSEKPLTVGDGGLDVDRPPANNFQLIFGSGIIRGFDIHDSRLQCGESRLWKHEGC